MLKLVFSVLTSWWFLGAVGWILVIMAFPIESGLPVYAG